MERLKGLKNVLWKSTGRLALASSFSSSPALLSASLPLVQLYTNVGPLYICSWGFYGLWKPWARELHGQSTGGSGRALALSELAQDSGESIAKAALALGSLRARAFSNILECPRVEEKLPEEQ